MQSFQEEDYTKRFDLSLWKKLLHIAKPFHKNLYLIAGFMSVSAIIDVALPMMNSYAIDNFITGQTTRGMTGFVYYINVAGVTGARKGLPQDFPQLMQQVKSLTSLPVASGFGIASRETAREAAAQADGVITGSGFVRALEEGLDTAAAFVRELAQGIAGH